MLVRITIYTELGIFNSADLPIDEDEYDKLKEVSQGFYSAAFDMELDSGGYIIIPPDVISRSVMVINIL